jgi:probable rRNA maturation factor
MGTVTVNHFYKSSLPKGVEKKAKKVVGKILRDELRGVRGEVCVTFVDDREIRRLNKKFRKLDRATDVLSFETGESGELGDVVISVDTARRNAKRFGVTIGDEIRRLVIHGVLHLLGYDHDKKKDKAVMRKMEEKYLND